MIVFRSADKLFLCQLREAEVKHLHIPIGSDHDVFFAELGEKDKAFTALNEALETKRSTHGLDESRSIYGSIA